MTPAKPKLRVTPELCDGCRPGHYDCERACKESAIRVGKGFVYVDWDRCTGCLACVDMCDAGALEPIDRSASPKASGQRAPVTSSAGGRPASAAASAAGSPKSIYAARDRAEALAEIRTNATGIWTEVDGLIALMVMLGSLVALNAALRLEVVTLMPPSGRVFARAAGLAIVYGAELGVIYLLAKRHKVPFASALRLKPVARSFRSVLASTGLVVALLVASRLLTSLYGLVTHAMEWEPVVRWNTDLTRVFGEGWAGLSLTVALVVFVGPFVEELTFRGVVQPAARRRWGSVASVIATSVLFATYHFDPWMFVPTLVLGLALGWLAEKRDGLWPPIALHVLYNAVTVVAVFWVAGQ